MESYRITHIKIYDLAVYAENETDALAVAARLNLERWTNRTHTFIGPGTIAVGGDEK